MLDLLSGVIQVVRIGLVHAAREHEVVPKEDAVLVGQFVKVIWLVNATCKWRLIWLQCDQIGWFIALWATFKASGNNYFAQITHILGNFCKDVKIFDFYWNHFGATFIDI